MRLYDYETVRLFEGKDSILNLFLLQNSLFVVEYSTFFLMILTGMNGEC